MRWSATSTSSSSEPVRLGARPQWRSHGGTRDSLPGPDSAQGAPGVLLAGDAVGVAPWLGDRIPMALGTGVVAAHAAADGLAEGRLDFSNHAQRVRESASRWQRQHSLAVEGPICEAAGRTADLADRFAVAR